ncbi:hypothetical protein FOXB_14514, partial [Fusarium oxysporum f. sp. conglutinans Fo5176]
LKRQAAGKA